MWLGTGQQQKQKEDAAEIVKTAILAKMPKDSLKALKKDLGIKKKKRRPFVILGQNVIAFRVFVALRKCWRIDSMSGSRLGLDYHLVSARISPILEVQKLSSLELSQMWDEIDFMEDVALAYWRKYEQQRKQSH